MVVIHRVIDAEVHGAEGICYVYTRLASGHSSLIRLRAVYEVVIGLESVNTYTRSFIASIQLDDGRGLRVKPLGIRPTYHRGEKYLVHVGCSDNRSYQYLTGKVQFDSSGLLFLCGSYSSPEDVTLLRYGIYASLYVAVDGDKVRPATVDEEFEYHPRVAGFDMEMLSLNPVDPGCDVYMVSYSDGNAHTVIYTSGYLGQDLDPIGTTTFRRVSGSDEMMVVLSEVMCHSDPDIVTGYNLYNADIPMCYYAMGRSMVRWHRGRDGAPPYFHLTKKMVKKYMDSDAGMTIRIPGTHVVDMYPYLEDVLSRDDHKSLKLGDVSEYFLGQSKDPLSYKDLDRIYHNGTVEEKVQVMMYCAKDATLPILLYQHFGVWDFHSAMYSICGTTPDRLMSKGMVDTTYGMCNRKATDKGIFMDHPSNPIFAPSGGFVMPSRSGYYENVYCLDVESMYPNITIQHNIDPRTHVEVTPQDVLSARPVHYYLEVRGKMDMLLDSRGHYHGFTRQVTGVLPSVLRDLLVARRSVKAKIRACEDPTDRSKLVSEDQALKRSANSGCGALGEQTPGNPMSSCILNDIITTTGRRIISLSRECIESMGGNIIYGDTDSIFVTYSGDIQDLIDALHGMLPSLIRFKLEYVADRFIMGKKKHYAYRSNGTVRVVGYKGDKSSSCVAVQMAFRNLVRVLLEEGPDEAASAYDELVRNCCNEPNLDMDLFTWRVRYSGKSYSVGTYQYMLMETLRSRGVELVPGNSLDVTYVMRNTDYVHKYGREPSFPLPDYGCKKHELIYTLDELGGRVDLVDVEAIFELQCKSVLSSMMQSYAINS